ncbi:MAG: flagellar biosynthesis anti-sigma factor FlgM [Aquificaceae bacterium]|nr:flagellar biosynthesis anti-sigma factor FlgM [Aquificaceae bacterium]MCX8164078.1 flagellar biosynthesis anti-sigma factor FlgM [Aquificaceae bacterium]
MIERIELQKVLGYITEAEERKNKRAEDRKNREEVRVELSRELRNTQGVDYEDLSKKVEQIKQQLERGAYEVSPEKILKGLEKFLSSK